MQDDTESYYLYGQKMGAHSQVGLVACFSVDEYDRGLFRPFGSLMRRVALWPTLGNHDYGNEGTMRRRTARAYFRNFVLPATPGRERFDSFRYANAEFLAIDDEVTSFAPGSRQYRWIDATLRRSRACWTSTAGRSCDSCGQVARSSSWRRSCCAAPACARRF